MRWLEVAGMFDAGKMQQGEIQPLESCRMIAHNGDDARISF